MYHSTKYLRNNRLVTKLHEAFDCIFLGNILPLCQTCRKWESDRCFYLIFIWIWCSILWRLIWFFKKKEGRGGKVVTILGLALIPSCAQSIFRAFFYSLLSMFTKVMSWKWDKHKMKERSTKQWGKKIVDEETTDSCWRGLDSHLTFCSKSDVLTTWLRRSCMWPLKTKIESLSKNLYAHILSSHV